MKMGFFTLLLILVLLTGCAKNNSPEIIGDNTIADTKAEQMLSAFNTGDYDAFSKDFSEDMKKGMAKEQFENIRAFVKRVSGDYVGKALAVSKEENGYKIYGYDAAFSLGSVFVTITFSQDMSKVEGFNLDSQEMRNAVTQNIKQ